MKNPTPGFEDVIRRNFFLKKEMILAEVDGWIERDKSENANSSDGLTTSHNPDIACMLGESDKAYRNKMIELRKELVAEFAKLDSPYPDDKESATKASSAPKSTEKESDQASKEEKVASSELKEGNVKKEEFLTEEQAKLDLIDVSYATPTNEEESKE